LGYVSPDDLHENVLLWHVRVGEIPGLTQNQTVWVMRLEMSTLPF
jgi:hypothetical protein